MLHQGPSNGRDLIRELFKNYFSSIELELPDDFILREFAFQDYHSRKYIRHISFQSIASLREYLIRKTPLNSYYSAAIYRDPAATNMEDKGLIGAELMFDIDVDHIKGCNATGLEINGKTIHLITNRCFELGKDHELKLLDILQEDFGFSRNEIMVYFTGNRGFHTVVRPEDKEWLELGSPERREIIDYIKGIGLDVNILIPKRRGVRVTESLKRCGGWRRRIFASISNIEELKENLEAHIEASRVEIDEQVTQDLSRLVRIPRTINGKSGLPVRVFKSNSDLISFSYGIFLSPFKGNALVRSLITVKGIKVLEYQIDLVKDQTILIPAPVAIYLGLNGAVEILRFP